MSRLKITSSKVGRVLAAGGLMVATILAPATSSPASAATLPTLTISAAKVLEGDSGTRDLWLPVTLSSPSLYQVTVKYASADGIAKSPKDYTAVSGTLSFAPGSTLGKVRVPVLGDTYVETDETLKVRLSSPTQATVAVGTGIGTIRNDDPKFKLTVTKTGSGTGTVASSGASGINCGTDCTETYPRDTTVPLTATPAQGSTFTGWTGACTGTGTCNVTMGADRTVQARFDPITFKLTVTKTGSGTGTVTSSGSSGISCGTDCSQSYPRDTTVGLTATPAQGSTFTRWAGACTGTGPCIVTMGADRTVEARFDPVTLPRDHYTLSISMTGNGTGYVLSMGGAIVTYCPGDCTYCPADCGETYPRDSTVSLTAFPHQGSTFTGWAGACSGLGACTVTMGGDRTVEARFDDPEPGTKLLLVQTTGSGSGTVTSDPPGINCHGNWQAQSGECYAPFPTGSDVTLTATPDEGWIFGGFWNGPCDQAVCTLKMDDTDDYLSPGDDFFHVPAYFCPSDGSYCSFTG